LTLRSQSEKAFGQALSKLDAAPLPGIEPLLQDIFKRNEEFVAMRGAVDAAMRKPRDQRPGNLGRDWVSTNGNFVDSIDRLSVRLDGIIG